MLIALSLDLIALHVIELVHYQVTSHALNLLVRILDLLLNRSLARFRLLLQKNEQADLLIQSCHIVACVAE